MNSVVKIFRGDKIVWALFLVFCLISLVEVYSASSSLTHGTNYWMPILKHAIILVLGVFIALVGHAIKPRFFILLMLFLPVVWALLLLTKLLGSSVNDAQRWMDVGGFSFQPSELAKICLIATVAFFMSRYKNVKEDKTFRNILIATGITFVFIITENFSTAALLVLVVFLMLWVGPYSKKKMAIITLIGGGLAVLFLAFLMLTPAETINKVFGRGNTWTSRIEDFREKEDLNPETYKIGDKNKQRAFSQIAISSGGFIGKLPGNTKESEDLHLAHTDFIYSIIIEEMGIIGGAIVLFLYIILFIRAGKIANRCEKLFPKYIVMGSAIMIVSQAMVNMAVAVDLLPITGQNLPLISKGGSSVLVTSMYIGIILSVSRYENAAGIEAEQKIEDELLAQEAEVEEKAFWDFPETTEEI